MPSGNEKVFNIEINYNNAIDKIAELKGRLQDVNKAQKDFAQALKAGKITQEEYNKAMSVSKIAGDSYRASIRDVEKAVKNQIKTEKEQEGSLKQLRAQLSNATSAYDGMSRAEREGASGKALQQHINEITRELKQAEEATQRYYRNVGNYENAIKNALGINTKWGNTFIALGKEIQQAGGFMNMARGQIQALSTSMSGLLANPLFLAIAGLAGAGVAFKWWVDYNTGLQEATRLTQEFTGKSGEDMQHFRNEVSAVADTFDKDFKEVLNSADQLAVQFGISVDEAMDLIKNGFVAGADAQGNFLRNLQQYPASFREAGLSAEEFTAIVSQTKSGIFDESGLNAIKQANARIRQMSSSTASSLKAIGIDARQVTKDLTDGTKSTFDVLQEVSARLSQLPPASQEVGNALVNVFGRQGRDAGLQMIETLATMSTDLDEVKNKTGELGTLQEREMQANIDLQNALASVFDFTGGTFESLKTNLSVFLKEGMVQLLEYIKSAIQYFKDLYDGSVAFRAVVEGLATVFRTAWNAIKTIFGLIGTEVKAITTLVKGIFTLDWRTIQRSWETLLDGLLNGVKNFVSNGIKEVGRLFGVISKGRQQVQSVEVETSATTSSQNTTTNVVETEETTAPTSMSGSSVKSVEDTYSKELQLIRQAEDEMIKLIRDSRMQQQLTIEKSYDRQIEDLKRQLETEKNLTEAGREAINTTIRALEAQRVADLDKLGEDELQQEITYRTKLVQLRLESVRKGSEEEYALRLQQIELNREKDLSEEEMTEEMRLAIIDKYDEQRRQLLLDQQMREQQMELDAISARYEAEFELLSENEYAKTELMVQLAQERLDAIQQLEGESDEAYLARYTKARNDLTKAEKKQADEEVKIEKAKTATISGVYDGLVNVTNALGESNEKFAKLSKVLALGEIMVSEGKAIAEATEKAMAMGFPAAWVVLAQAIPSIIASIASAISTVNSANFAEGGLVTGAGTGTSDSIPANLSNGESVITARATSMFAPLLSSINQIGGGVPIDVAGATTDLMGDDYINEGFATALEDLHPIVTVEDINRVSRQVEVAQTRGAW